jgi:hypothetical protein
MPVVKTLAVNALVAGSMVTVPIPVAALEFGGVSCAPDNEAVKPGAVDAAVAVEAASVVVLPSPPPPPPQDASRTKETLDSDHMTQDLMRLALMGLDFIAAPRKLSGRHAARVIEHDSVSVC